MPPGKAEHQRRAQHHQHHAGQARARKAQPLHGQRPHHIAQHAPGMPGQQRLETIQARPLQRRAGAHQQQQPAPEHGAPQPGAMGRCTRHGLTTTHPARQRRQPGAHPRGHAPPDGETEQKIAAIGQPGTKAPHPVGQGAAAARAGRGPGRVLRGIADHGQQPEHQGQQAQDKAKFMPKARRGRAWRRLSGAVQGIEGVGQKIANTFNNSVQAYPMAQGCKPPCTPRQADARASMRAGMHPPG